jgi:hypothetical protein
MGKYEYTEKMDEISGFGGGYEEACRKMVIAGLEWCDENQDADLGYKEFENVYGLTTDESEDTKKMQGVMLSAVDNDCTVAMMQATMSHVMFVRKNGWDKYVEEMEKREEA